MPSSSRALFEAELTDWTIVVAACSMATLASPASATLCAMRWVLSALSEVHRLTVAHAGEITEKIGW
jgi:hypothetical protein